MELLGQSGTLKQLDMNMQGAGTTNCCNIFGGGTGSPLI